MIVIFVNPGIQNHTLIAENNKQGLSGKMITPANKIEIKIQHYPLSARSINLKINNLSIVRLFSMLLFTFFVVLQSV